MLEISPSEVSILQRKFNDSPVGTDVPTFSVDSRLPVQTDLTPLSDDVSRAIIDISNRRSIQVGFKPSFDRAAMRKSVIVTKSGKLDVPQHNQLPREHLTMLDMIEDPVLERDQAFRHWADPNTYITKPTLEVLAGVYRQTTRNTNAHLDFAGMKALVAFKEHFFGDFPSLNFETRLDRGSVLFDALPDTSTLKCTPSPVGAVTVETWMNLHSGPTSERGKGHVRGLFCMDYNLKDLNSV